MVFFVVVGCYTSAYFGFSPQVTYLLQLILVLFGLLAALAVSTGWFWSRELNLDLAGGVVGGFNHLIRVGAFCFTGHVSGSRLQNKHRQRQLRAANKANRCEAVIFPPVVGGFGTSGGPRRQSQDVCAKL